jgi:hypothetical protein
MCSNWRLKTELTLRLRRRQPHRIHIAVIKRRIHGYGAGIRGRLGGRRHVGRRRGGGLRQRQRLFFNVDGIIEFNRIFEFSYIVERSGIVEREREPVGLQCVADQDR